MNDLVAETGIDIGARISDAFMLGQDDPAVEQNGVWYRYSDLAAMSVAIDRALDAAGLMAPGTKVGMLLRSRPVHYAAALAILRRGGCILTINPMLPAGPLAVDIEALAPPVILGDPEDWQRPEIRAAAAAVGALGLSISFDADHKPVVTRASEPAADIASRDALPGVAIEMLTSGTTGKPKRIQLERAKLNLSLWTGSQYETADPSRYELKAVVTIHITPLVHIGGLWSALYNLYNGRRLALLERFDADRWRDLVVEHRPKLGALPPSALRMVLERNFPKADIDCLVAIRTGTAPVDPAMIDAFWERYGIAVLDAYGATEFAGGVAGWNKRDFVKNWQAKRGSVGKANVGVELRVVDQTDFTPLAPDLAGLLEVKSDQIGRDKGWVRTTDLVKIDADGYLFILGRADSAINRGGFKVMPEHVQSALAEHPAVREASVVGLADDRLGQVPVAAIELNAGHAYPGDDAIKAFLRERVKPYEIPVAFRTVAELPRTPSMKVSQPEVRTLFEPAR